MELIRKKKKLNRRKHNEPLASRVKRPALRLLKAAVVLAVLPVLAYGAMSFYRVLVTTEYLAVSSVIVTGAVMVAPEEAVELSGISEGQNILSFNAGEAVEGLKGNPWVKDAEVKRRLPGAVEIVITERVPAALVLLGGEFYVMDASGTVFMKYSVTDRLDLPVVTGLTKNALKEGGAEAAGLLALMAVLKPREGFINLSNVSEINVDPVFGLSIYTLDEGVRLAVGSGGFAAKLASFDKVVTSRGGALGGIEAMDLNNSRSVVVRFTTKAFKEGGANGQKG